MKYPAFRFFLFICFLTITSSQAAEIQKANVTTALNLTTSWTGAQVPGSNDVALWDTPYDRNVSLSSVLGDNLSWKGIRVVSPTTVPRIRATSGKLLTLGASGIDMSAATQNFDIYQNTALVVSQEWNVASGRILTVSAGLSGSGVTLSRAC